MYLLADEVRLRPDLDAVAEGRVEFRGVTFGYEPHRPVLVPGGDRLPVGRDRGVRNGREAIELRRDRDLLGLIAGTIIPAFIDNVHGVAASVGTPADIEAFLKTL